MVVASLWLSLGGCVMLTREDLSAWRAQNEDTAIDTGSSSTADTETDDTGEWVAPPCESELFDVVRIEPGTFQMGSETTSHGRDGDEASHEVTLTRSFCVATTEVTRMQFSTRLGYDPSAYPTCDDCPVEDTTWYEAAAYANAVSAQEGLLSCYECAGEDKDVVCVAPEDPYTCEGWRLLTEAEWEYAARAGADTDFYNGGNLVLAEDATSCSGVVVLDNGELVDDILWYCGNSDEAPNPVGQLDPNNFGLYDTSGNVYEWVNDIYRTSYDLELVVDPIGPTSGTERANRGGSTGQKLSSARLANRGHIPPTTDYADVGLRIGRSLE